MYVNVEIVPNTWTLISDVDVLYQVRTGGTVRIWTYEGTTIPTATPSYTSNEPFWLLSDGSTDTEDFEDRFYETKVGESLWLYSESKTVVVKNA